MIVLMAEPITDTPDIAPRKSGTEKLSLTAEPRSGFADHLQFALDCRDGFPILEKCFLVEPFGKLSNGCNGVRNIS